MLRSEQVHLALSMSDGTVAIMGFITRGLRSAEPGELPDLTVLDPSGGPVEAVVYLRDVSEETVAAECAKVFEGKPVHMVSWRLLDGEPDLSDEYRNAWTDVRAARDITHDMAKSRELYRGLVRGRRAALLAELDVAILRADEDGNAQAKAAAIAEKRRLRDAPADPRIEAAASIDELRTLDVLAHR